MSVSLKHINKQFVIEAQKIPALTNINLDVKPKSVVAITGKSGAGKSTLLHIIGTLDKPSSGDIFINNTHVSKLSDKTLSKFRNQTIGFVFQMNNLLNDFSAIENVMMPGLIAGTSIAKAKDRAVDILKLVRLSHRENHRPGELSGGEQQRVAIARALFMNPPIFLADEPTGNLDQKTSTAIQDLLLELCYEQKSTLLIVTHDQELAKKLPQQIILEDGHIIDRGCL